MWSVTVAQVTQYKWGNMILCPFFITVVFSVHQRQGDENILLAGLGSLIGVPASVDSASHEEENGRSVFQQTLSNSAFVF